MFIQYFFLHRVPVTGIPKIILDKQKLCSKLHMTQFTCIVFFVIHHHRFKKTNKKNKHIGFCGILELLENLCL